MSSCGAGGQSVISVHCFAPVGRFGRDSRFNVEQDFLVLSLQTLVRARRTVVFLALQFVLCTVVTGVTFTLSCFCWEVSRVGYSAVLVWCCAFGATSTICDGGRSPTTAEAISVCVGHGQNDRSGARRRSKVLSPATDSEDSFDSRIARHHRKDVRFSERPLLDSHSRWRRVSRAPVEPRLQKVQYGSTRGTNPFRRQ